MAVDVTLTTITTGYNLTKLNANFTAIANALADAVSRSNTSPNSMSAVLDMNSQQIINLIDPVSDGDAVRKGYGDANYGGAAAAAAVVSAAAALVSENNASTSETNAATSETNAATSASAASTSATAAAASETAAGLSETAAATSETNAATSETNAATSATASEVSNVAAAVEAAAAVVSAAAAVVSATNAATSETNAATSATASEVSNVASEVSRVASGVSETASEVSRLASGVSAAAAAVDADDADTSEVAAAAHLAAVSTTPITATGTATSRTLADRFAVIFDPRNDGAVFDGVADDAVAIQTAIDDANAAGGGTVTITGFALCSKLVPKTGVAIMGIGYNGCGLKLKAGEDTDLLEASAGIEDCLISGMTIDANRANQTNTEEDGTIGSGIMINSSTASPSKRVVIEKNYVIECHSAGIQISEAATDIIIKDNIVDGTNEWAGIELSRGDGGNTRYIVTGNHVQNTQKNSIGATSKISHLLIGDNYCGIGGNQSGANVADNITAYNLDNTFISVVGNVCEDSGNHGIHVAGDDNVITGNIVDSPAESGIYVIHSSGSPTDPSFRTVISGNTVRNCLAGNGLYAINNKQLVITGNSITGSFLGGIQIGIVTTAGASDDAIISGNLISGNTNDGILCWSGTGFANISNNVISDNGRDGIRFADSGIAGADNLVANNVIQGNTGWGIRELNNTANNLYSGNKLKGNGSGGIDLIAGGNTIVLQGWGQVTNGFPDITSVAGVTVIPPDSGEFIRMDASGGATQIDNIRPTWPGRKLLLYFKDGNTTLADDTNGNNGFIKLNGGIDITPTASDMIMLVSDGGAWFQVGPISAN